MDIPTPASDRLIKVHWVLPSDFVEEDAGMFTEEARKLFDLTPEWSTIIRDHNQKDYECIDVEGISFPGFLKGDRLDEGGEALNDYTVTLSRRAAELVGKFLNLLSSYGAEVQWEVC